MKESVGMVLGKFLPPHQGHQYLVEFAQNYVDKLYVVVGTLKAEPIAAHLRVQWMKDLFPNAHIIHLDDENPQYPEEHVHFWQIWQESLLRVLPEKPDFVFASEDYGYKLAEVLDAKFVPCNKARDIVPVSATLIRTEAFKYWSYIPRNVRPYFLKKVCIFGPESTGKSTLTEQLAKHYETVAVPEYARTHLESLDRDIAYEDIEAIARGHLASQKALEYQADRLLFCDTDLLATMTWSEVLFGKVPEFLEEMALSQNYDLYLVLDVDVNWVEDPIRYLPNERQSFFEKCIEILERYKRPYRIIRGDWQKRFDLAVENVENLVKEEQI